METPETIRHKIDKLINERGLTYAGVSKSLHKGVAYIQQYIKTGSPLRLGELDRKKLAQILNVNEQELTDIKLDAPNYNLEPQYSNDNTGRIPEVDVYGGCGCAEEARIFNTTDQFGNTVQTDNIRHTWTIPAEYLNEIKVNNSNVYIIEALGDSMYPTITSGDKVIIDTSAKGKRPSPAGIFAIWDGVGIAIKRLEIIPNSEPAMLKIMSDNPKHSTYERTLDECIIIGRAAGLIKRL